MATKKTPTTAVVPWEAEMAARAQKQAKAEKVRGLTKKLGTRGGVLTVDDEPIEDNELRCIVVAALHENQYYDKPFNPNVPAVPGCYAFSEPEADEPENTMAPHEEAEEKQGDDNGLCANCWANKMGSADVGRGKACKNIRRLALITEDALESAEALAEAEMRMLNVPVMSTNNWSKFVNKCAEMGRTSWGVVCTVKLVSDPKSQFKVVFTFEELITFDADLYAAMTAKVTEGYQELSSPYPKQADLEQAAPPARGGRQQPVKGPVKGSGKAAPAAKKGGGRAKF